MQQQLKNGSRTRRRLGIAIVGVGGAVATTAIAGMELIRIGAAGYEGLPLAGLPGELTSDLAGYEDLVFGGWDLNGDHLAQAARIHNVLPEKQLNAVAGYLSGMLPWKAIASRQFCRNIDGKHVFLTDSHRESVAVIREDLARFRRLHKLDGLVVLNLASTEGTGDKDDPQFQTLELFERALDANERKISPAMLYAYSAIRSEASYVNFTPSVAADLPALIELSRREGVPLCGKDGKTGQTMIKTVLAPAFRMRALRVDGWYSTNILGNRDGLALNDKDSLASKLATKGSVLNQILGYAVDDHLVDIRYYKPRADNKESWDNIDITGFLGQPMQIKVNFLCRDSILAAPLALESCRLLDLAQRRGESGIQPQLGVFYKQPMSAVGDPLPENALHVQQEVLLRWLAGSNGEHAASEHESAQTESVAGD
jgi:myo-inositol-1-phosphate synthase